MSRSALSLAIAKIFVDMAKVMFSGPTPISTYIFMTVRSRKRF